MRPNPALRKLGYADDDRVAIIHADDIGMCQATLTAFAELFDFGLVSCGAAMTPCPWFPSVATYAADHPSADIGVHLTLNCEYSTYRWGPLSTRDPASGLLDADGCFFRLPGDTQRHADPAAVRTELEAQVALALAAGIDVSHVDTHMGTVAHRRFAAGYVEMALAHRLPLMLMRYDEAGWRATGLDAESAAETAALVQRLEASGVPLVDDIVGMPLDAPDERIARAKAMFDALPPGITHFVLHPAADTPELRAITPEDWPSRVGDHRTFMSEELREYVRRSGVQIIGYRALRDLLRG
jgi:chitin disaccharide deacetylase